MRLAIADMCREFPSTEGTSARAKPSACSEQNASDGTDHGAAGVGFVIGSRVRGEMIGEFPGLDQLDENDNERFTADFRGVYCALLEQWFGQDAAQVIPGAGNFQRPAIIA